MNSELISVLEHLEREKGVSRHVLLEAVNSALVSAAKKVLHNKDAVVEVKIDETTGDIGIYCDGKRIESNEFGRIAAQTAKQVIIQKIREAERDAVYDEFFTKVNSIVSGTVYRYDKGAAIIDLGKTEAILPKREQTPRDNFRQGDRIRLFVLEVSKAVKGPQIIVSRSHPGLVKRLFELEVPEVLDGIVEIKAVSRDPGDRSKIAVWSKDEKVDCVGACVGMRGMRVKNIVRELQGEKIDIVRWSENVVEYVQGALSPAKTAQVSIVDPEQKKIEVVVDDDQLSLAIGKNGQNVRLAAKLTGWNIDILSRKELAAAKLEGKIPMGEEAPRTSATELTDLPGVGPKVAKALEEAGIANIGALASAGLEKLMEVPGIGEKTAKKILESIKSPRQAETATEPPAAEEEAAPDAAEKQQDEAAGS